MNSWCVVWCSHTNYANYLKRNRERERGRKKTQNRDDKNGLKKCLKSVFFSSSPSFFTSRKTNDSRKKEKKRMNGVSKKELLSVHTRINFSPFSTFVLFILAFSLSLDFVFPSSANIVLSLLGLSRMNSLYGFSQMIVVNLFVRSAVDKRTAVSTSFLLFSFMTNSSREIRSASNSVITYRSTLIRCLLSSSLAPSLLFVRSRFFLFVPREWQNDATFILYRYIDEYLMAFFSSLFLFSLSPFSILSLLWCSFFLTNSLGLSDLSSSKHGAWYA